MCSHLGLGRGTARSRAGEAVSTCGTLSVSFALSGQCNHCVGGDSKLVSYFSFLN